MAIDPSNGYEAHADAFIKARSNSGKALVRDWAKTLPDKCTLIDIGAASGVPLTEVLIAQGLDVFALDASPRMVSAFKARFPQIPIAHETAQDSTFFNRTFHAALAVGLIFLLPEDAQSALIEQIARKLEPNGELLFSAPVEAGTWQDMITGQTALSLGRDSYIALLEANDLTLIAEHKDEGGSHYYQAQKR